MKLFIDTDMGDDIDDAMAIAYVLAKGYDVVGVTTVYREPKNRVGAVRALLDAAGATKVPVYAGHGEPIGKNTKIFGKLNYSVGSTLVNDDPHKAIEFMAECADRYGNELVILAIGAQTNLAHAVKEYPDKMGKIGKAVIMGGCFTIHQNEWNIAEGPTAAKIVAESVLPLVYVPWNVTKDISLGAKNYDFALNFYGDDIAGRLSDLIRIWSGLSECKYIPVLHDVCAAMCVADNDFCTIENVNFCVIDSGPACGITLNCGTMNLFAVDDFYKKQILLATSADAEKIAAEFISTVYNDKIT